MKYIGCQVKLMNRRMKRINCRVIYLHKKAKEASFPEPLLLFYILRLVICLLISEMEHFLNLFISCFAHF